MRSITPKLYRGSLSRIEARKLKDTYELEVLNRKFDVKVIRTNATGLSQAKFADKYNLNLQSLKQWEKSPEKVRSSIRTYLNMIYLAPKLVDQILNLSDGEVQEMTREDTAIQGLTLDGKIDVSGIREQATGLSQSEFARYYYINVFTLQKWEQNPSRVTAPNQAYLFLINRAPKLVKALADAQTSDDAKRIQKAII